MCGVPKDMEMHDNVNGPRRKELAAAVGNFLGAKPQYMKAQTYSYQVGSYNIGRDGTLTGEENPGLIAALAVNQNIQALLLEQIYNAASFPHFWKG